ncbi:isopentenyl-diphosphate Delta-isomerase [Ferruginibacter sp.]|uniref:isopentenyl-diphosphate Delta-isomerase n=1 Tax=Ferruginibacter sp. TaxID=1940288 RepID=UPI002657EC88|nr:isopentenyl-diphosphate Delta-isomerase [Ferruginibacter sp.]
MDVILVDENDVPTGTMEKMEVHQKAMLHRAFSVFIFNSEGEMLLQKRSAGKYHSPSLWTNTCCSHPAPGQEIKLAAAKRLMEEMGFTTQIKKAFEFIYKAPFDNGLTEYEYDHVFTGTYDGTIIPDKSEVSDYCFQNLHKITTLMQLHPEEYTEWFKIAFPKLQAYLVGTGY